MEAAVTGIFDISPYVDNETGEDTDRYGLVFTDVNALAPSVKLSAKGLTVPPRDRAFHEIQHSIGLRPTLQFVYAPWVCPGPEAQSAHQRPFAHSGA